MKDSTAADLSVETRSDCYKFHLQNMDMEWLIISKVGTSEGRYLLQARSPKVGLGLVLALLRTLRGTVFKVPYLTFLYGTYLRN